MMTSVAFLCLEWSRERSQKGLQLDATAGSTSKGGTEDCLQGELKLRHIIAVVLLVMLHVRMPVCFPVLHLYLTLACHVKSMFLLCHLACSPKHSYALQHIE